MRKGRAGMESPHITTTKVIIALKISFETVDTLDRVDMDSIDYLARLFYMDSRVSIASRR